MSLLEVRATAGDEAQRGVVGVPVDLLGRERVLGDPGDTGHPRRSSRATSWTGASTGNRLTSIGRALTAAAGSPLKVRVMGGRG